MSKNSGTFLVVISIFIGIAFVYVASTRQLTDLENALFQAIALFFGIFGSFILGKESTKSAAKEIIKPYARSAFRRLISLYYGLSRLAQLIEYAKRNNSSKESLASTIDKIEVMTIDQLATADDALNDWRDIVPEDVEELYNRIKLNKNTEQTQ